jgi:hypothetical protein
VTDVVVRLADRERATRHHGVLLVNRDRIRAYQAIPDALMADLPPRAAAAPAAQAPAVEAAG